MTRDLTPGTVLFVTGFVTVLFLLAAFLVVAVAGRADVPAVTGFAVGLAGLGLLLAVVGVVVAGLVRLRRS